METTPEALLNVYGSQIPDEVYYGGNTHIYLYGCYGMALTLMMLVTAVTQVFGTTALPSVTAAYTSGNKQKLKESIVLQENYFSLESYTHYRFSIRTPTESSYPFRHPYLL